MLRGYADAHVVFALIQALRQRGMDVVRVQDCGRERVERTMPMLFSLDETCDLGKEAGSPVSPDYGPRGNEFSGERVRSRGQRLR